MKYRNSRVWWLHKKWRSPCFPMGPTLKQDFPEIINFTRVNWDDNYQMTFGEKRIYLPHIYFVDTAFLAMFDFPLLKGNRANALLKPNSAVLTESAAKKLFGDANPIGKTINHYGGDTLTYTVTGILKDIPNNSQLQFDALFSFNTRLQTGLDEILGRQLAGYLSGTGARHEYRCHGKKISGLSEKTYDG